MTFKSMRSRVLVCSLKRNDNTITPGSRTKFKSYLNFYVETKRTTPYRSPSDEPEGDGDGSFVCNDLTKGSIQLSLLKVGKTV